MDKFVAENTLFVVVLAGIGATVIWGLVSKMTDFVMTYFLRGSANVKKLGSWAVVTVRPSSPAAGNERFTCLDSYAPQLYLLTEIVFCAVTSSDVCRDSSTTDENVVRPQGATDGIGKAVAFELAKKGMNIMLVSRTAMKLQEVKEEIAEKFSGIEIKMVQSSLISTFHIPLLLTQEIGAGSVRLCQGDEVGLRQSKGSGGEARSGVALQQRGHLVRACGVSPGKSCSV